MGDRSDMRKFLMAPAPKGAGVIQCYIKRTQNGKNKKNTTYQMFFQDDHKFMLYGRKMPKNRTSNYRVSMRDNDDSRDGPDFLGKVRAKNTWGTEFVVYDTGINPKDAENARGRKVRREFGVVHYETNVLGSRGPHKMHVGVPSAIEGTDEYKEFFFDELPAGGRRRTRGYSRSVWTCGEGGLHTRLCIPIFCIPSFLNRTKQLRFQTRLRINPAYKFRTSRSVCIFINITPTTQ